MLYYTIALLFLMSTSWGPPGQPYTAGFGRWAASRNPLPAKGSRCGEPGSEVLREQAALYFGGTVVCTVTINLCHCRDCRRIIPRALRVEGVRERPAVSSTFFRVREVVAFNMNLRHKPRAKRAPKGIPKRGLGKGGGGLEAPESP